MSSTTSTQGGPSAKPPGRPAPLPQTDAGAYLAEHLMVTKTEFARRLELAEKRWEVSRLINGNTPKEMRKYDPIAVCDAAGMNSMNRREFLALLGVTYSATLPLASVAKFHDIDVDEIQSKVRIMDALVGQGKGDVVYPEARITYDRLRQLAISPHDNEVIGAHIAVAKVMVEAQELMLAWTDRAPTVIATYNAIQRDIFLPDRRDRWAADFLWLCSLRAVRYRENEDYINDLPEHHGRPKTYANTAGAFRMGADYLRRIADNPALRIAYRCQSVHALANQGSESQWQSSIDTINRDAETITASVAQRRLMLGLVDYFRAVGFKRLAWNLHNTPQLAQMRREYARRSLHYIHLISQDMPYFGEIYLAANQKHGTGLSFEQACLLWRSTEAEATVWLSPQRTIEIGQSLLPEAERWYPGLIKKIRTSIAIAESFR